MSDIAVRPAELANRRLEGKLTEGNSVMAPADWQMLAAIAETVQTTEFVPVGLRGSGPKVLACMLYGHSLGIHPMVSLKEIAVIDGTPSMSAALMVAKVMERGHEIWREELWEADEQAEGGQRMYGVRAHGKRHDNGREDSFTFTLAMARRAGLMGKKNWQNYPEAMLWHRASSQLCTFLFPDVFMGSPYMPEELGADGADAGIPADVTVEVQEGTPLPQSPAAVAAEAADITETLAAVIPPVRPDAPAADPAGGGGNAVDDRTHTGIGKRTGASYPEAVDGATTVPPAEAAVSPQDAQEPEPTREPQQAAAATEAPAEPQTEPVSEDEGERPEGWPLLAGFWTPLDERAPTEEEYRVARALIAGDRDVSGVSDDELEEFLAAAQDTVEAYEAPPEEGPSEPETAESVAGVSVKGTGVEVMLRVADAASRDDLTTLGAMLELERAQSRPRVRVVAGIEEAIDAVRARTGEQGQQPVDAAPAEAAPAPAFTPEPEPAAEPAGPVPFAELPHAAAVEHVAALLGVIEAQEPHPNWTLQAVVAAGRNIWKIDATALSDFTVDQLEQILVAAPQASKEMLEHLPPETVTKMAAQVLQS